MSRSDAALARYRTRLRRSRIVYFSVLAVLLAVVGVVVGVAWSRGEVAHTTLRTVGQAPPSVPVSTPAASPRRAWSTPDRAAIGTPQWGGTVITYSTHTVGGRDARTGAQTWSYTRSDRAVCTAAQLGGTTIAIYRLHGNCDEVSAFNSGTGHRRWTRTLDKDGQPIDGTPRYQTLPYTLLVYSPQTIYAIDPVTGLDRWTYTRYGCRIDRVALGSAGALIGQDCSAQVRCTKVRFCATGPQLVLRDGSAGNGDDSDPNADHILWLRTGTRAVPASADTLVSALDGATLDVLDTKSGKPVRPVRLSPAPAHVADIVVLTADTDELLWLGDRIYAIRADADVPEWTAPATGAPTLSSGSEDASVPLLAPVDGRVALLDGAGGRLVRRYPVPVPAGGMAYPLGAGFLVAGPAPTAAYR